LSAKKKQAKSALSACTAVAGFRESVPVANRTGYRVLM